MHWRDRYAYEAKRAGDHLRDHSERQLVERIRKNSVDHYFATWRAIGRIGTIRGSAMVLWEYLRRNPGKSKKLHRYHCAAALFTILGIPDPANENPLRKSVQWDHQGEEARQEALQRLKEVIEAKIAES